jgi:hypothetical protein
LRISTAWEQACHASLAAPPPGNGIVSPEPRGKADNLATIGWDDLSRREGLTLNDAGNGQQIKAKLTLIERVSPTVTRAYF